ncbi:nucleotidyltransferase domain-containing protein [Streptomyces iconiensis]|uniref:Nucleotidyltransferase domain-containing protein n=1 Tax=Streptomyces iconiensis TaxID=1384038 RepID=A0ABT6ZZG7_9ACTN|nr:nucleotidyltransferase domain-containing protein [Streptomyces iconiensis]MDJ1134466.1 nucleotidyltransferase domain-containing protein [Streptomyces iconiensis]
MDPDGLISRISQVLQDEQRVLAAWLSGSRGRGTADAYSDVDVWLVVAADDVRDFTEDWPKLCDRITPTVLRQQVRGGPVFNAVTPEWLRFDVAIGTPEDVPSRSRSTLKPLFDRAGLTERLKPEGEPLGPDAAKVAGLTTEFLRVLGLLPVVIGRQEYVVAASGAGLLRQLLIQLMLEDVAVEDRGGVLHLDGLLPPERMRTLSGLPPIEATRSAAVEGHLACARAFLPLARELHGRCGLEWPRELEEAARRHLRTALDLELG